MRYGDEQSQIKIQKIFKLAERRYGFQMQYEKLPLFLSY